MYLRTAALSSLCTCHRFRPVQYARFKIIPDTVHHGGRVLGQAEDTGHGDICGFTVSGDSRSSETLQVLKEFGIDVRASEIHELHQEKEQQQLPRDGEEIETRPIDHEEQRQRNEAENVSEKDHHASHRADHGTEHHDVQDFPFFDTDDVYDREDEASVSYGEEEVIEEPTSSERLYDVYEPVGLRDILQGICECLQPVPEARPPTPPPPDPFEEFLKRMKTEVEEDRLQIVIKVPGIGPPVSVNRITAVGVWLAECGRRQEGMVGPRNLTHFLCPELEDNPEDDIINHD